MENKNIIIGGKDPKKPEYYRYIYDFLKEDLKIMKRVWYVFDLKHPEYNEIYKCSFVYFRREYINQVAECLSSLDFDGISKIPHENLSFVKQEYSIEWKV